MSHVIFRNLIQTMFNFIKITTMKGKYIYKTINCILSKTTIVIVSLSVLVTVIALVSAYIDKVDEKSDPNWLWTLLPILILLVMFFFIYTIYIKHKNKRNLFEEIMDADKHLTTESLKKQIDDIKDRDIESLNNKIRSLNDEITSIKNDFNALNENYLRISSICKCHCAGCKCYRS